MQDEKSAVPAVKEQCDAATPEEKKEQPCHRNGSGHIWTSQLGACYCYIDYIANTILLDDPCKGFLSTKGKKFDLWMGMVNWSNNQSVSQL